MPYEASKGNQTVKEKIVREFRAAATQLGRHSGFASYYRESNSDERIVTIVERSERMPDFGFAKRAWVFVEGSPLFFFCSFLGPAAYAHVLRQVAGVENDGWNMSEVAMMIALAVGLFALGHMLAARFQEERRAIKEALAAVNHFRGECADFVKILGFENGTAKDIIDRRFVGLALRIVTIEMAMPSPRDQLHFGDEVNKLRVQLRTEHALVKKFGLGKGLQAYFDRAKVLWANLAQQGVVRADYSI